MGNTYKFLDEKNALAILPVPEHSLREIDEMLDSVNRGEHGGVAGCITRLVQINKKSRFSKKPWGRLAGRGEVDLVTSFTFINFDEQDDYSQYFYSYGAWQHGTPQAPMLQIKFDRKSGAPPKGMLENDPDAYVLSRRVVSVPLQYVIRHWGNVENGYMIYEHSISAMDNAGHQFKEAQYYGLTSRNWQTRYKEHQRDALKGSELLFHTSLAAVLRPDGVSQVGMGPFELVRNGICLTSELQYANLTYEEAMNVEEKFVERTLHPNGLNMVPGGFAGMKFLHKLGYLDKDRVPIEQRDYATARYLLERCSAGKVAPWVSGHWSRDEFYEQVIFNRKNTLNKEQVLSIRKYGNEWGFNAELIANLSGASIRQVRDVLSGKYYSRVH